LGIPDWRSDGALYQLAEFFKLGEIGRSAYQVQFVVESDRLCVDGALEPKLWCLEHFDLAWRLAAGLWHGRYPLACGTRFVVRAICSAQGGTHSVVTISSAGTSGVFYTAIPNGECSRCGSPNH